MANELLGILSIKKNHIIIPFFNEYNSYIKANKGLVKVLVILKCVQLPVYMYLPSLSSFEMARTLKYTYNIENLAI